MSRQSHNGRLFLIIAASIAIGVCGATAVHRFIERPKADSPLLREAWVFTIYIYERGILQTDQAYLGPPKESDSPIIARFCDEVKRWGLPKKCPSTIDFDLWCASFKEFPTGWPFVSRAFGYLACIVEHDCKTGGCRKYWDTYLAEDSGSRFRFAGFVGNSVVYSASAFILIMGLRHARAFVIRRRRGKRGGFPVTIADSADRLS